jgi:HAD superfamily phosphoserine phosphatase-like hydrolase
MRASDLNSKKNIVVFDFDGTLSAGDLNYDFWKYAMRHSIRPWLFLPLTIFGIMIKPLNKNGVFWREVSRRWLNKKLMRRLRAPFLRGHRLKIFGWAAERIAVEKSKGNITILISASPNYLLRKLIKVAGWHFDIFLCSRMDGEKPWKYDFLCYGKNKLKRLNETVENYRIIRAYSDNVSDMPIMSRAAEQIWINPKTGMRI